MAKSKKGKKKRSRAFALRAGCVLTAFALALGAAGNWFVHHPRTWLDKTCAAWPRAVTDTLFWAGNPVADITDGLGWTGHDAVYEYDRPAPAGDVLFAGLPRRIGAPCPADVTVLDRGPFKIGWSPSLRHPVWCAYHVTKMPAFAVGKRPSFLVDREVPSSPHPSDYRNSGYDRGHMVPNYAIVTRYGEAAQRRTFMMSNIAPQSKQLNRSVWRDVEHRIADLWTARYGEIWVIVGCISTQRRTIPVRGIDIPDMFYQLIVAQEGTDVRAMALLFEQRSDWGEWAARHLVTIDELETLTGLDFLADLDDFIEEPLEADLPTRLWPVRLLDIFAQVMFRFNR